MGALIIATGGTIASLPDPESGGVKPALSGEELVAGVPELSRFGPVEVVELEQVNGWNMTPTRMLDVVHELQTRLADATTGAVVTHGTDTVEETAFLCELLVGAEMPVVFAAAMRSGAEIAADGPRNLVNAVTVAVSPDASGWGSLVTMNDELHSARWCRKLDSYRASAFSSPDHGPVGAVTPERLRIAPPPARVVLDVPEALAVEVPVVKTYTGMGEELIETVMDETEAGGIVLEGTGAGNVPGAALPGIRAAIRREVPVAIAASVPAGGVVPIYGGPGGGMTLREEGVMSAGGLPAGKARLLLMVCLSVTESVDDARRLFTSTVDALAPGAFGNA